MPTQITKVYNAAGGAGVDFTTSTQVTDYINGLDLLALDQNVRLEVVGSLELPSYLAFGPLTSDDSHRVTWVPASGQNVNVLYPLSVAQTEGASGAQLKFIHGRNQRVTPGQVFRDLRINLFHVVADVALIATGTNPNLTSWDVEFHTCRFIDVGTVAGNGVIVGNSFNRTLISDCVGVVEGAQHVLFASQSNVSKIQRSTLVARGNGLGAATGTNISNQDSLVFIGFGNNASGGITTTNSFANTAQSGGGMTVVTGANALVVNDTNDFRPKAGGALIGAGGTASQNTPDILGSNRSMAPDAGAYQLTPGSSSLNLGTDGAGYVGIADTLTISTTGGVTGPVTVTVLVDGVSIGTVDLNTGSTTGTINYTPASVGTKSITVTNNGGLFNPSATPFVVTIPPPSGAVTSQPAPDGQNVSVTFSTANGPTSGTLTATPDATDPQGATLTTAPVTLGSGTGTVTATLPPGKYTLSISLTNAGGPGAVTGLQPVTILGITGEPEVPGDPPGETPTVTVASVTVSPSTATGSATFSATVNGTNSPAQTVTWSATGGSVTSGGVFTAPSATNTEQVIIVTATSTVDVSKSGNATVTIAAIPNVPAPAFTSTRKGRGRARARSR